MECFRMRRNAGYKCKGKGFPDTKNGVGAAKVLAMQGSIYVEFRMANLLYWRCKRSFYVLRRDSTIPSHFSRFCDNALYSSVLRVEL
jgi:hypothetical protein